MARLTKVLKTDVMADLDLKGLAQVLRSHGRGRDTVLAHITPQEAAKLKREGGAGTINPVTGLPEFQNGDYFDFAGAGDFQAGTPETYYPDVTSETYIPGSGSGGAAGETLQNIAAGTYTPEPGFLQTALNAQEAPVAAAGGGPVAVTPPTAAAAPAAARLTTQGGFALPPGEGEIYGPPTPQAFAEQRGYFDRLGTSLEKQLSDPATLARLGLGLGTGALGLLQQQRAAGAARQARRETAAIGAPYRAQGQELINQARAGELSPASMQAYQAMQAQVAQQTARQGGVGAAQGAAALERLRAQLIQNQYNLGLNVANIGDRYLAGAIQSGQQANQALMTATNQFYSTLGSMLSGPTGQAVATAVRA
jgi:hypothetical protein